MASLHCAGEELIPTFTNHFLAHLQVAVGKRFANGQGFMLMGTAPDPDGGEVTFVNWLHPSIPLSFSYDVTDDSDERVPPVTLDSNEIAAILKAMDEPTGVRATDGVWLPFTEAE